MTAYDLFKKAYLYYIVDNTSKTVTTKRMQQAYNKVLEECNVEFAGSNCIRVYGSNLANKDCQALKQVELQEGYWLCHYDKLSMIWAMSHYIFEEEAIARRKAWHRCLFRVPDWFLIVKVGDLFVGQ